MAARDPAKENVMLCKIFGVTLEPSPSPDLEELAAELDAEGKGRRLDVDGVERVLVAKLSRRAAVAERLSYCRDCFKTSEEIRRDAKFPAGVLEQLPKAQTVIGNYAALSLTLPEVFGLAELPIGQAAGELAAMWERRELPTAFLLRIVEAVEEETLPNLLMPLLTLASTRLRGRDLSDQKTEDLGFITAVCNTKGPLAKLLVKTSVFHPPPSGAMPMMLPGMRPGDRPGEGFRLQTESLLGWVISPTCLDSALYKEKSARQMYFQSVIRKTRPAVEQCQRLLRSSVADVQQQIGNVLNPLLRAGEDVRQAVLAWFGDFITGTECRTKSANCLDGGGGPNGFIDQMENSPTPMYRDLDARLQMQLMQARMMGFATPGAAVNAFWSLMALVKPIKLAQVSTLDPFYILNDADVQKPILGGFTKESRFGDSDEVDAAKKQAEAEGKIVTAVKFPTQIFWLAMRALHVFLVPVLKEDLCFVYAAGYFQSRDVNKMDAAFGEHLCFESIFNSSSFLADLATFLNLQMAFCLAAAWPQKVGDIVEGKVTGTILTDVVSPQWSVLPSCVLEDIIEVVEYYITTTPPGQQASELFIHLNTDMLLMLVTFMLGSGEHVKNPNLRGKATTILKTLIAQPTYLQTLQSSPVLANDIIPGCIRVFTAVEKTKQSYYDIRMQLKYQLRIPIMELFEKVLPLEAHKKSLKTFAQEHSDEFLKFLNNMMNDATMQLEEGLDTLLEIRRIMREGGDLSQARTPAPEDEQTGEGADIYARSRADPKEHCKTYMKMGNRTIRTLWSISREAPSVIVTKLNVLQQLIQNCLNPCLDRLVGPRCLELKMQKGARQDFDEYNFTPKELLQMVCEIYLFVSKADREKVQKLITEDGRSYRPKTFAKAATILGREQLMPKETVAEFEAFVKGLNDLAASQEAAMANIVIPDNYLDPIMSEIMEDPVRLPTSKTVMDRKVIERHIMSNDDDPFNRMPLSVKDLEPLPELRAEIHAFCAKHGLAVGSIDC